MGSNPIFSAISANKFSDSSLQCRGIAQLVEQWSPKPRAEGSSPSAPAKYADVAQVVAHILGKDEVTSSSLVISSKTVIVFHDDRFCFCSKY